MLILRKMKRKVMSYYDLLSHIWFTPADYNSNDN